MYKLTLFLALFAVAYCAEWVPIVHQENVVEPDGKFHWSYESGDGTKMVQSGDAVGAMQGSFEYKGDDNQNYVITYVADENGYQPHGDHLPVPPPVPEPILRALEWIAAHPHKEEPLRKH